MLPTGDPLGTVVTMLATPFGRLDGLAIDTAGAGGWLPTDSPPDSPSVDVIDGLPGSVSFPRRKVVVDGPPWGKIVGQRSPDTAIAVAVEDGINHGPHLGLAWPPTGAGRRQEGLQDSPLLACQITGVWLRVHTLSTFEPPFWNRLLEAYQNATSGQRKGTLFRQALLACALARVDAQGYFVSAAVREPFSRIMGKEYQIPGFSQHLDKFSSDPSRGPVLEGPDPKKGRRSVHSLLTYVGGIEEEQQELRSHAEGAWEWKCIWIGMSRPWGVTSRSKNVAVRRVVGLPRQPRSPTRRGGCWPNVSPSGSNA